MERDIHKTHRHTNTRAHEHMITRAHKHANLLTHKQLHWMYYQYTIKVFAIHHKGVQTTCNKDMRACGEGASLQYAVPVFEFELGEFLSSDEGIWLLQSASWLNPIKCACSSQKTKGNSKIMRLWFPLPIAINDSSFHAGRAGSKVTAGEIEVKDEETEEEEVEAIEEEVALVAGAVVEEKTDFCLIRAVCCNTPSGRATIAASASKILPLRQMTCTPPFPPRSSSPKRLTRSTICARCTGNS